MKLLAPLLLTATYLLGLFTGCQPAQRDDQPRKIEVIFLGHDSKHHDSYAYMPMLAQALGKKGIHFTYTSDLNDLNPQKLAAFDALMLYANHDSIAPAQEAALLDFVKGGKGFLPVHCASFCFRNSEEIVALMGGQFKSHETGTFTATVTAPDDPLMAGFQPF